MPSELCLRSGCAQSVPRNDSTQLIMLAPRCLHSSRPHEDLIGRMQRLRGRVYVEDEAIDPGDLSDGRHRCASDARSWHILLRAADGAILGCVRALVHKSNTKLSDLSISAAAKAMPSRWQKTFNEALTDELDLAAARQVPLIEVGGLALDKSLRGSSVVVEMIMAIYSLSRDLGGAVGLSTATTRHSSASILRRMGGESLEHAGVEVPAYYDEKYGCEMEVLKFYSWAPSPRQETWRNRVRRKTAASASTSHHFPLPTFAIPGLALAIS